jgi:hypothetical protein
MIARHAVRARIWARRMSGCPYHAVRPELEPLTERLARLPVDDRGYPVPWFVAWHDGKPEFRAMDATKWAKAVRERRCWVCGDRLGAYLAFVIGPMCGVNRTSAEPPCHLECAAWSARNCPFLVRPQMVRREDDEINESKLVEQSAGTALSRNPGVAMVWVTKSYSLFDGGGTQPLIRIGEPVLIRCYAHGRLATRKEVIESVESGLPTLMTMARDQQRIEGVPAVAELERAVKRFEALLPA